MKTVVVAGILAITAASAAAQVTLAPEVGAILYNQTAKATTNGRSMTKSNSFEPGLRAGALVDLGISEHFSVQPGVFYVLNRTTRRDKVSGGGANFNSSTSLTVHAVQVPVYAVYKTGTEGSGRFFAGLGGYITYHIAGSRKFEGPNAGGGIGVRLTRSMTFGDNQIDDLRRLDFGPAAMLGYQLANGLYIKGQYQYGLANMQPIGNSNFSIKSMSFGLSVGYSFGRSGGWR